MDCHMQLQNKQRTFVFANSWRRSRVTRNDELFKLIKNKTTPTTHLVKNQKWWFVTWAMYSCSSYAKQFQRCNAQNAFFIGIKELSIALVDISWKKVKPANIFTNGDWMLSQSRTTLSRRDDLEVPRQNWSTERAFHGPQCSKEMSQKEIWRNARSLPKRLNVSWFEAQNWLDWRNVHCDGQNSTGRPLLLSIAWRVRQISEELEYHTEQIRKKCTNETPIRLPRSTYEYAPSPPWIWRRATWTNSLLSIPKVAFVVFFIQYFMVAVERTLVELINQRLSITSELMEWAASKNRETCFGCSLIKKLRVEFLTRFFKFVVVRSFTVDSNLLQPTGGVNRTPSHVTFSRTCMHSFQCRTCLARITSCHHAFGCAFDLILFDPLLCTLHRLSHLPFHSPVLHLHFPCGWFDEKSHAHFD